MTKEICEYHVIKGVVNKERGVRTVTVVNKDELKEALIHMKVCTAEQFDAIRWRQAKKFRNMWVDYSDGKGGREDRDEKD